MTTRNGAGNRKVIQALGQGNQHNAEPVDVRTALSKIEYDADRYEERSPTNPTSSNPLFQAHASNHVPQPDPAPRLQSKETPIKHTPLFPVPIGARTQKKSRDRANPEPCKTSRERARNARRHRLESFPQKNIGDIVRS